MWLQLVRPHHAGTLHNMFMFSIQVLISTLNIVSGNVFMVDSADSECLVTRDAGEDMFYPHCTSITPYQPLLPLTQPNQRLTTCEDTTQCWALIGRHTVTWHDAELWLAEIPGPGAGYLRWERSRSVSCVRCWGEGMIQSQEEMRDGRIAFKHRGYIRV